MVFVSLAVCAVCGFIAAWPFRELESSLPVWFVLAPVFWIVARAETAKRAALFAFVFALVWTSRSFTFMWACAFEGSIAASLYTSVVYLVGLLCIRRVARRGGGAAVFGVAAVWTLTEILRSVIPIIYFPWLLLGHTLLNNAPLRQAADLFGVYGLSFILAAFNALLAFGLPEVLPEKWRAIKSVGPKIAWKNAWFLVAMIGGLYFYGAERIRKITPTLKPGAAIALVQGNVKTKLGRTQEIKKEQVARHVQLHQQAIAETTAKTGTPPVLVCWAETMVPDEFYLSEFGETFRAEVKRSGIPALTGSNDVEPDSMALKPEDWRIHNSAFLLDGNGAEILHYYKRRLVAFGEYIPGGRDFPSLQVLRSVTRDVYVPGTQPSKIGKVGGYKFALNLCVEDIHPCIAREAAFDGADALVNLTNDGWFYGTHGPRAHMMAAVWRSVETRRPLLRVTNTGRTVAVDPLGEITTVVEPETEGVGTIQLMRIDGDGSGIVTPYMRLGDFWTAFLFVVILWASLSKKDDDKGGESGIGSRESGVGSRESGVGSRE